MPAPPRRGASQAQINQSRQSQREIRRSFSHWLENKDRAQIEERDEEEGRDTVTGEISDYTATAHTLHERPTDSMSIQPEFKDWESIEGGLPPRHAPEKRD